MKGFKGKEIMQNHTNKWKALKERKSLKATLNDTKKILGRATKVLFY